MVILGVALLLLTTQQRTDTLVLRNNTDVPATAVRGLVAEWKAGEPLLEIGEINELAVGPDGRVYVWDWQTVSLWELSADGRRVRKIGRKGSGPGEYEYLSGLAVRPDGRVISWDPRNARLNAHGKDGRSDVVQLRTVSLKIGIGF